MRVALVIMMLLNTQLTSYCCAYSRMCILKELVFLKLATDGDWR